MADHSNGTGTGSGRSADASTGSSTAEKRELLGKLRIDRNTSNSSRDRNERSRWPVLLGIVAVIAVAAFIGWKLLGDAAPPLAVATAIVEPPNGGAGSAGSSVLDASGYVIARRQATVSAKITGKVVAVLIEEGMQVQEGQVLARLDDSIPRGEYALSAAQLNAARAGLRELDAQLRQARLDERRAADLAARKLTSQADADRTRLSREGTEARIARMQADVRVSEQALAVQQRLLDDLIIRAPFSGVIVAKAAQPGEMISPVSAGGGFTRTGIGTIVDMDSLEVEVDVNEAYINRVQAEQPATVILNAYPDLQLKSRVIAIIPTADRNKATVRVRLGFVDRDARILPDMGVKVSFLENAAPAVANALPALPSIETASLRGTSSERYVFVIKADNTLEQRRVRPGNAVGARTQIAAGLSAGERVLLGARDGGDTQFTPGMVVSP